MSDALASLRQALGPKGGMRRLPFPTETYEHPSLPVSAKRLLNLMVEQQPADARNEIVLISTPGLRMAITVGAGPILAVNTDVPGIIFVVSGTHFYAVTGDLFGVHVIADLGDVGTPSGGSQPGFLFISIAAAPTATVVCVPPNAFVSVNGGPVNQIAGTWPVGGASSVTYLDGYWVFTAQDNQQQFFVSRLLDPTLFDALDFASIDAFPNQIMRGIRLDTDVWFAGIAGWEIWYNSGDSDFPFRRRLGGVIERTIDGPETISVIDGSIFWLSLDAIVYRTNGYKAQRISTHGVENVIRRIGGFEKAGGFSRALTYSQNGHMFYCLTSDFVTLVYDCATTKWHDRSSSDDGSTAWRPRSAPIAEVGVALVGDSLSGALFVVDPDIGTEADVLVQRSATLPPVWGGTRRAFCNRLEVEMEVGGGGTTPGPVLLEWSDDGGWTWTGSRTMSAGSGGERRKRVYTTRLGSFRQRVFRITTHGVTNLYAVDASVSDPEAGIP
jgi:hypothetical protein